MTGDAHALKDATFEAMEVGEELGPIELVVDDHAIKSFAFTVDDYHPWFLGGESPFGGRVAHAAILVPWLLRLLNTRYDPNTEVGLHQKEEIWFDSPVRLGERVILTGSFTDKYVKRDKGYIVTDAEARSLDDGRLLVRHRCIEIARVDPDVKLGGGSGERSAAARYVNGEWPADREPEERVTRATAVGTPFVGAGEDRPPGPDVGLLQRAGRLAQHPHRRRGGAQGRLRPHDRAGPDAVDVHLRARHRAVRRARGTRRAGRCTRSCIRCIRATR